MKRVGRHTIVRELASSGVLSTFEATHEDGRTVRLRVLDRSVDVAEGAAARFAEELACAATLRHPGIDRPLAWSARAPLHVSTVRIAGVSLREICEGASAGWVAPALAAGLGADVAEALHAAHSAGLVHAGVSTDSIFLGIDGRARVTDFGVMRCLSELASQSPQVLRGSIESLSPEQLDAPDAVGPHTDVFGVGLALYRAMTAKPAFDAPSALGMSIRLSMGRPTPIESHGIEMPEELRRIVMKMLSAAPADRPAMDVVARTLRAIAGAWRDSARRLVAPHAASLESAPDAPSVPSEPTPETAPAEEARSTPDSAEPPALESFPAFDSLPLPTEVSPIPPAWAGRDESPLEGAAPAPLEPATRPEIALPPAGTTDDYATLFELRSPAGPSDGSDLDDDIAGAPMRGGDTSPWTEPEPRGGVAKTVILEAPRERPSPRSAPRLEAASLPPLAEAEPAAEARAGAPEWAVWTAIALGAFTLLVGAAALVVLIGA